MPPATPSAALVTEATLTQEQLDALVRLLIQHTPMLAKARAELDQDAFGPIHLGPRPLLLAAAFRYFDRHQAAPGLVTILAVLSEIRAENDRPSTPSVATAEQVTSYLVAAPFVVPSDGSEAMVLLGRKLREQEAAKLRMRLGEVGHGRVVDPSGVLALVETSVRKVRSVRTTPGAKPKMMGVVPGLLEQAEVIRTGVPFLDRTLGGGCRARKIYGIVGLYGAGKSNLGRQIAVEAARLQCEAADPGVCMYVSYEESYPEMYPKLIHQMAAIPPANLLAFKLGTPDNGLDDMSLLSTAGNLEDYERRHYDDTRTPDEDRPGERERFQLADMTAECLVIYDMVTDDQNAKPGYGGVPEIRGLLEEQVRQGRRVKMLVVDYLHEMVERHLTTRKESERDVKQASDEAMGRLKQLALDFGCAVWVMQQANAEANRSRPGGTFSHAHSAGSNAFAENLYACYTIGRPDATRREARQLCLTKTRDRSGLTSMAVEVDPWDLHFRVAAGYRIRDGMLVNTELVAPDEVEDDEADRPQHTRRENYD